MRNFDAIFNSMFLAILVYQALYFIVQYAVLKRLELFYYSMFLLCLSVLFYVYSMSAILSEGFKPSAKIELSFLRMSFQFSGCFFYLLFIIHYLELHKHKPRIYYLLKYYKYYNLLFFFVFVLLGFLKIESKILLGIITLITLPVTLTMVVMLWRINSTYSKVVLYGTTCTFIGSLVSHFLVIINTNTYALYGGDVYVPVQIGVLLDVFILGYGLSLKTANTDKKLVQTLLENQQIVEVERSRVAKDLHDGLGGLLSGIKLTLGSILGNVILSPENVNIFKRALSQLDDTIAEMRRVAHSMMPEALLRFGLSEAIRDYCDNINESKAVKIKFTQIGLQQPLEQSTQFIFYRIIQELTNNAIKHAAAKNIFVQLNKHEQGITLTVEDDGKGFDSIRIIRGAGLLNVQSRIDYLKGSMEINSKPKEGSSINIEVPM